MKKSTKYQLKHIYKKLIHSILSKYNVKANISFPHIIISGEAIAFCVQKCMIYFNEINRQKSTDGTTKNLFVKIYFTFFSHQHWYFYLKTFSIRTIVEKYFFYAFFLCYVND